MSDSIIKVSNLSKRYRIGAVEKGYKTLREAIIEGITAPVRNLSRLRSLTTFKDEQEEDVIWALRDISFEVKEGEVLGIIGRNGAGKTTILKILSRITEPTSGFAEISGRISSLLEVGTGFHPELTGRENVFLNGAILGMRKRETEQKFEDIVSFAEVSKFIDTPLKRYSSGMQVRLAFSIAAHLEPEILLVDEVLAVGDIAFQQKCLGRMGEVAKGGRTIIFVSHNMGAIRSLCDRVIWLDNGEIVKMGNTDEIVSDYQENQLRHFDESSFSVERDPEEIKSKSFYFSRVEMLNERNEPTTSFKYGDKLVLFADLSGNLPSSNYNAEFYIYNELGQLISVGASGSFHGAYFDKKIKRIKMEIGPLILTGGKYSISLSVTTGHARIDIWENSCVFTLKSQPFRPGRDISSAKEGACILQQSFQAVE